MTSCFKLFVLVSLIVPPIHRRIQIEHFERLNLFGASYFTYSHDNFSATFVNRINCFVDEYGYRSGWWRFIKSRWYTCRRGCCCYTLNNWFIELIRQKQNCWLFNWIFKRICFLVWPKNLSRSISPEFFRLNKSYSNWKFAFYGTRFVEYYTRSVNIS